MAKQKLLTLPTQVNLDFVNTGEIGISIGWSGHVDDPIEPNDHRVHKFTLENHSCTFNVNDAENITLIWTLSDEGDNFTVHSSQTGVSPVTLHEPDKTYLLSVGGDGIVVVGTADPYTRKKAH